MNVIAGPTQSNTKKGDKIFLSAADLTGLEGRLVMLSDATNVPKLAIVTAVSSLALFVLLSGDAAGSDNYAEQPSVGENFRARLNGTCVTGDILVLCDPSASAGVNAGKLEALAAQAEGVYFSPGVAEETGADEQLVLTRAWPRLITKGSAFTSATPASTAATNTTPYGYSQAQADAILTNVREMRAFLVAQGWKATS